MAPTFGRLTAFAIERRKAREVAGDSILGETHRPARRHMRNVPLPAAWLGGLGLIPFVALSVVAVLGGPEQTSVAGRALLAYGATILSFLGGIHWGFALTPLRASESAPLRWGPLIMGVIPQLLGWLALMFTQNHGLWLTSFALVLFVAMDKDAVTSGAAPPWFLGLRWPLSLLAALCLFVAGST